MKKNKYTYKNTKTKKMSSSYSVQTLGSHFRQVVFALFAVAVIVGGGYAYHCITEKTCRVTSLSSLFKSRVEIKTPKGSLIAEVADTDSLRELGLVGRKSLGKNEAMLFVFDKSGRYGWWAKGMLFSTDIVWIDEGGLIVEIERDVSPKSYPKSFINTLNSKYVLEMNAGQVQALGMYVGLKINIPE